MTYNKAFEIKLQDPDIVLHISPQEAKYNKICERNKRLNTKDLNFTKKENWITYISLYEILTEKTIKDNKIEQKRR
jgi:hypothetical protein